MTQERKANSIIIPAEADADDDMRERELHNDVAIFSSYIKRQYAENYFQPERGCMCRK